MKCRPSDASCPASYDLANGAACATANAYCTYQGLVCDCTNCTKGPVNQCSGPTTWRCEPPSETPGCPRARPNLGTACTSQGKQCTYGCEANVSRTCTDGVWLASTAPGGCAISLASEKDAIRYVDEAKRRDLASQALEMRLATWRYKNPGNGAGERLGFLLDDAPQAPASDMTKGQVDLYGYTSMVLALAQEQQAELARLRKRVEELERSRPASPRPPLTP